MKNKKLINWLCLSGVLSIVFYLLHDIIGAINYLGYNWLSQTVGEYVGWNPICIIIPCHRVIGSNGSLTGYGGGSKNKIELLKLEQNDISKYSIPKKGTKL